MRTLLQGRPYTSAAATDIRKTFAKERKRLKEAQAERERATTVRELPKRAKGT